MPMTLSYPCLGWLLVLGLLTVRVKGYVDECDSLEPQGLRGGSYKLRVDAAPPAAISDRFRFQRNHSDDGFVQYRSQTGFKSVTVIGYVYLEPESTDNWRVDVRTRDSLGGSPRIVRIVNASNIQHALNDNGNQEAWRQFRIHLSNLPRCPKVIEIWLRGRAAVETSFGRGLQLGKIVLSESVLPNCTIPSCLNNRDHDQCFQALKQRQTPIETIHDPTRDYEHIYEASENIIVDGENAVRQFNGDGHRFRRLTNENGTITYHIPEGIASMDITLFKCDDHRMHLFVLPSMDSECKELTIEPVLTDDRYYSECWKRYKTHIDFESILRCPPTYVQLVIDGDQAESPQISTVTVRGYGKTRQSPGFTRSAPSSAVSDTESSSRPSIIVLANSENATPGEGNGESSPKLKQWLPATIVGIVVIFAITSGVLLFKNGAVSDAVADYIEDNFPFIYKCIYPPDPPAPISPSRAQPGRMAYNTRTFAAESINFSCTFDKNLKTCREAPASRDVAATREGLGEQLIDLSKHLQKAFWTSKIGKKQRVLEIEEQIGRGGYGKVWRARWQGTLVALKVVPFHANLNREEKQARMAIMEAALSGCLAHPNIVATYACEIRESNESDTQTEEPTATDSQNNKDWMPITRFATSQASTNFIKNQTKNDLEVRMIMEFCDRGSLVAAIKDGWFRRQNDPGKPDFEAILLTALDIARGLFCLHENDIIHGDLKPHNVLIQNRPFVDTRGFIAKIADFGLSIKMESEQSHVDGMRMGTLGYVSPEVAVRGKILPASDIYSFGILLWELYSGELIHDAIKNEPKLTSKFTMGSWRPLFEQDCPQEYSRLACMCWNDFPDWRPGLEYIIDELNGLLKSEASPTEEGSTLKETPPRPPHPPSPPQDPSDSNNLAPTMALS